MATQSFETADHSGVFGPETMAMNNSCRRRYCATRGDGVALHRRERRGQWDRNKPHLHYKFGGIIHLDDADQHTTGLLNILQNRLANFPWLAIDHMTVADIAVYLFKTAYLRVFSL